MAGIDVLDYTCRSGTGRGEAEPAPQTNPDLDLPSELVRREFQRAGDGFR